MFYNDHEPAHFHVRYNEYSATIAIETLAILQGKLPPKVQGLVVEWATQHQQELVEDWHLARELKKLRPIAPLE